MSDEFESRYFPGGHPRGKQRKNAGKSRPGHSTEMGVTLLWLGWLLTNGGEEVRRFCLAKSEGPEGFLVRIRDLNDDHPLPGYSNKGDEAKAHSLGAGAFLIKLFSRMALLQATRRVLDEKKS